MIIKAPKHFNKERNLSSTNGARKVGCPYGKKQRTLTLLQTIYKFEVGHRPKCNSKNYEDSRRHPRRVSFGPLGRQRFLEQGTKNP